MKLVAQVKLVPDTEAAIFLDRTVTRINQACEFVSHVAWDHRIFTNRKLRGLCYEDARTRFGLSAQVAQHAIKKVADAYKSDYARTKRRVKIAVRPDGAVTYDDRILSWKIDQHTDSIWTTGGRKTIPFVAGERSMKLLSNRKGECDLVRKDGMVFLLATCDVEEPEPLAPSSVIGVDRGIVNLATCSNGANYTGAAVNAVRVRNERLRQRLQAKNTQSARRLLKKRHRKETRFVTDTNHKISYRIVREAERTGAGIAMEDLHRIRDRIRARRPQRRKMHTWSFHQLLQFVAYKAMLSGVPLVLVDPRNTSRRCPMCHYTSKRNRPTRDLFRCQCCGLAGPADLIAAVNIAFLGSCDLGRGEVTRPDAGAQVSPARPVHGSRRSIATATPHVPRDTAGSRPRDPHTVLPASSAL